MILFIKFIFIDYFLYKSMLLISTHTVISKILFNYIFGHILN